MPVLAMMRVAVVVMMVFVTVVAILVPLRLMILKRRRNRACESIKPVPMHVRSSMVIGRLRRMRVRPRAKPAAR